MVSCYPEIGFHDNPADARFILDNKQKIAEALAKGVCGYFGVAYVPASSTGGTTVAQGSELDRLREENGKLQQDVISLNARISTLESKLEKVKQAVA